MKPPSILPSTFVCGSILLGCGPAMGEPLPERPKFTSKIHIPVKLAAEATVLPPLEKSKKKPSEIGSKLEDLN